MNPERVARPGSRSGARAARDAGLHWCRGPPVAAAPGRWRDGTGSGSWSCRRGCIRAAGWPDVRAAAMTRRDAARLERGQLRPRTRLTTQAARPVCRPARSAFFGRRIRIANAHHTVLALAHRDAGFAPGAALLPAQPGRVQGAPDRIGADLGQPIRSLAQGFLQQAHGPGGRAILLALWGACPFGQNALLLVDAIADPRATSVAGSHGSEPVAVEAADPGGDGLVVPPSNLVSGGCVTGPLSNGQQRSTCAAGALGERLRRVNAIRSSAVSGRRGSFRWRDMGHLVSRGSPHHYTRASGK